MTCMVFEKTDFRENQILSWNTLAKEGTVTAAATSSVRSCRDHRFRGPWKRSSGPFETSNRIMKITRIVSLRSTALPLVVYRGTMDSTIPRNDMNSPLDFLGFDLAHQFGNQNDLGRQFKSTLSLRNAQHLFNVQAWIDVFQGKRIDKNRKRHQKDISVRDDVGRVLRHQGGFPFDDPRWSIVACKVCNHVPILLYDTSIDPFCLVFEVSVYTCPIVPLEGYPKRRPFPRMHTNDFFLLALLVIFHSSF